MGEYLIIVVLASWSYRLTSPKFSRALVMVKALLKTGETIELPIDQMLDFLINNRELIQIQNFAKPLPPRRQRQNSVENSTH